MNSIINLNNSSMWIFCLFILFMIGMIILLVYETKIKYSRTYKRIEINDIYIKRFDDPWRKPKIVCITDKEKNWLRIYDLREKYYETISVRSFVDEGYKFRKINK